MHPDEIEEMDYQANAYNDYMWEAYGAEAAREAKGNEDEEFWDYERECDVRNIPTVREARFDDTVKLAVQRFLDVVCLHAEDNIPF